MLTRFENITLEHNKISDEGGDGAFDMDTLFDYQTLHSALPSATGKKAYRGYSALHVLYDNLHKADTPGAQCFQRDWGNFLVEHEALLEEAVTMPEQESAGFAKLRVLFMRFMNLAEKHVSQHTSQLGGLVWLLEKDGEKLKWGGGDKHCAGQGQPVEGGTAVGAGSWTVGGGTARAFLPGAGAGCAVERKHTRTQHLGSSVPAQMQGALSLDGEPHGDNNTKASTIAFLAEVVSARMPQLTQGARACPGGQHHISVRDAVAVSTAVPCASPRNGQATEWGDTATAAVPMTTADHLAKQHSGFSGQWALGSSDSVDHSLRKQKFSWIYRRIVTHMCRRIGTTVRTATGLTVPGGSIQADPVMC
jgi:hypothetical protein